MEKDNILNKILLEIDFVKRVILSCKTIQQYDNAIDWSNRWKDSRKEILLKLDYDISLVDKIFDMKHVELFSYNKN